jgi:hypothetical protein
MPRSCLMLVSLLIVLTTASGLAQTSAEFNNQRPPSPNPFPQTPQFQGLSPSADRTPAPIAPLSFDESEELPPVAELHDYLGYRYSTRPLDQLTLTPSSQAGGGTPTDGESIRLDGKAEERPAPSLSDFMGYRYASSSLNWIPGGGDQFGYFSIEWNHYIKSGINNDAGVGMGFYFLSGPDQTDMPPRVYDFSIGYQIRDQIGPLKFDFSLAVLAASDFAGDAHKGVQMPGHGVGFLALRPNLDLVFGIDYLDRGDIKLLPVAGLIWVPNADWRFELVFPRPRIVYQLTERHRLYVGGELGGGTWAIERWNQDDDLATYRDLRVCIGVEDVEKTGQCGGIEIAYLFDRRLQYTSGIGDMNLGDTVMVRLVTRF